MPEWVRDYLNYLGVHFVEPSVQTLVSLYQAHLARVPYEVSSKFIYFEIGTSVGEWIPSSECFVRNLTMRGLGGNCYILNFNFARLLATLGFETKLVKVHPGHVGIVVAIGDHEYFVDVGYGAPLNELFPLHQGDWSLVRFREEITFTHLSNDEIEFDRWVDGKSLSVKKIHLQPVVEDDFYDDIKLSFQDSDDNRFMRRISMAYVTSSSHCWVRNNRIVIRSYNGEQIQDLTSKEEWLTRVSGLFGISQDDLEFTISFLTHRGVDLGFTVV